MRHLIDTYIQADEPRKITAFDETPLLDLIVKTGIADAIAAAAWRRQGQRRTPLPRSSRTTSAARSSREHLNDPAYYEKMSALLDEIIADRKAQRHRV